ncbi:uncharacterized protein [Palaemon carinicauda]|uniref:uncharacterized protein n=1 Tax=Palaemon carinicauda TaxID=392227 RepID=UPI0035B5E8E2
MYQTSGCCDVLLIQSARDRPTSNEVLTIPADSMKTLGTLILFFLTSLQENLATPMKKCLQAYGNCSHRPQKNEFWVYIFSTTGPPCWGLLSYHSGIGFTDSNGVSKYWYYGSEGVVGTKLGCSEDRNGIYSYKVLLGHLDKNIDEVQDVIDQLSKKKGFPCSNKNGSKDCFTVDNYQTFTWNCNYFTAWVSDELGLWNSYPSALWSYRFIG